MNINLQDFMSFLYDSKLVDIKDLLKKDEIGCINRLKLQKYVYFAQTCLNNNFGYEFNIYNNGPYSPELANYYYEVMNINKIINADTVKKYWKLDDDSFTEKFLDLFKDKEPEWLVIASILIDSTNYLEDEQEILDKVYAMKSADYYSKDYIDNVWNDLKNKKLVRYKTRLKINNLLSGF